MRVTSSTYYKDYAKTVQDLHSKLNKTMQQVSSGRKYESASDDPLAYYAGKKIDNLYNDLEAKNTVIKDVSNRLYQQEQGALSIQTSMRTINTELLQLANEPTTGEVNTVRTINSDFQQRLQTMANTLNTTYENFYVYGGNDPTTVPFSLDQELNGADSSYTLNFHHKFPGESNITTTMSMKYTLDNEGNVNVTYSGKRVEYDDYGRETGAVTDLSEDQTKNYILQAMREEGRMSLGYGNLENRDTLPDTFTGGLNMLTGLNADGLKAMSDEEAKEKIDFELTRTPIALTAKSVLAITKYVDGVENGDAAASRTELTERVQEVIGEWDASEQRISDTYRELGIKQAVLSDTTDAQDIMMDTLTKQYTDKLGIDSYDAVVQMYQQQYSYNAAMKVGSNIMQSSLFDYVK